MPYPGIEGDHHPENTTMTRPPTPRPMAIIALVTLAACGTDTGSDRSGPDTQAVPRHQTRDSAGVRIIENRRPAEGSRLGWRIGTEPALTIGSVSGDEAFQLHQVDDAFKLGDGRIVVANGGAHQLLVFDEDGSYLSAWGRKGEGPGDFGGVHGADAYGSRLFWTEPWPGDSIAVCHGTYSLGLDLFSVFDSAGSHSRTVNLARDASNARCRDVFHDGSILASRPLREWSGYPPTGIHRYDMQFALLERDGAQRADLGIHRGAEEFYYLDEAVFPPTSFWMFDPPFQRNLVWGAWGNLAIVSPTDSYEIRAYGADGSLARIVRRDHDVRAPQQADLDAYRADLLAQIEGAEYKDLMTAVTDALPLAPSFPAFSAIEVDRLGHLWVREYDLPGEERSVPLWTVFDSDGIVQGFVETPADLVIYEIGEDYILGKVRDELRVEYVQLWELARSG